MVAIENAQKQTVFPSEDWQVEKKARRRGGLALASSTLLWVSSDETGL